jgi:hydrogenase maturation protein HypF
MTGRRIEVRGTVQGVGFRPWVYRLAQRIGVRGRVRNDARGVTIEAFGTARTLELFIEKLRAEGPSSARIVDLSTAPIPPQNLEGFVIESSHASGQKALSIPPDLATCTDCESEIFDVTNRRYRYPFTNCTGCGPRFTIATGIPYDRASTTMASFEMCSACRQEYDDVEDRRFHAQPNACPACGPRLRLLVLEGSPPAEPHPLDGAIELLKRGAVVAVKGLGGFHLACDAANARAIRTLRERKRRDEKPFAVMVRDLCEAQELAEITADEESLLLSPERPIVLLPRFPNTSVARELSPETPLLGLFLPYTPLHHLLVRGFGGPLVMTSANFSDEPICKDNDEAQRRLAGIADALLLHDRDIAMRCDDSVVRLIAGSPTLIRRSRGFVPRPFMLDKPVARPVLACGAHLKNAICLVDGDTAYFGPHIGDLETVAALEFFEEAIDRMERILSIRPQVIAHDLHPGYLSTRYALRRNDAMCIGVQHHHAHVVSVMAEHARQGPVLGVAYDGTGFGEDGTSWGGEFLLCFQDRFERLATFRPLRLPGGNLAMREVWRVAYALLHDAFDGDPPLDDLPLFREVPGESIRVVEQMLDRELNAPLARGVGRYFDAFGSLAMSRPVSTYEGQIAIAWDFVAGDDIETAYPFDLDFSRQPIEADLRPAVRAAVVDIRSGAPVSQISARFHGTIVEVTLALVHALSARLGRIPVALTGGVFQNARLSLGIQRKLSNEYEVLRHREVPPGDGGIALGQALIADAFLGEKD